MTGSCRIRSTTIALARANTTNGGSAQGRYDRGDEFNARWHEETRAVERALDDWLARREPRTALELACGTGLFTHRIARHVGHVTAVDASPEVIAINRARVSGTACALRPG